MDTISRLNDNIDKLNSVRGSVLKFVEGLSDKKSFVETGTFLSGASYIDGVAAEGEGVLTGYATVSGIPVYLFVQNFEAMRGSFSYAQAEKIEKCINMAAKSGTPFISVIDTAGARLDDGTALLEGYSKIIKLAAGLKGVVPHIAVIKGTSVGLMSAYACQADAVIFEDKAVQTLVSPSVVKAKENIKDADEKVFNADVAIKNGAATLKYKTVAQLKDEIYKLLNYLSGEVADSDDPNRTANNLAENIDADSLLGALADNGEALKLSEGYADATTALCRINGYPAGVIAVNGELAAADFKKIKKFVNLLDSYNVPLVTLLNSNGAKSDYKHEIHGLSKLAAEAFTSLALSDNPKIAVITGNAIGIAYSLLASKSIGFDYTLAFSGASVAPLSAEQAVNFEDVKLKTKNPVAEKKKLINEYTLREGNPFIAAKEGFIDNIINADDLRPYICSVLQMLM